MPGTRQPATSPGPPLTASRPREESATKSAAAEESAAKSAAAEEDAESATAEATAEEAATEKATTVEAAAKSAATEEADATEESATEEAAKSAAAEVSAAAEAVAEEAPVAEEAVAEEAAKEVEKPAKTVSNTPDTTGDDGWNVSAKEFPKEKPAPAGEPDWIASNSRKKTERKGEVTPTKVSNKYGLLDDVETNVMAEIDEDEDEKKAKEKGAESGKESTGAPVDKTTTVEKTTTGSVSGFGWFSWPKFCWRDMLCTVFVCLIAVGASGGAFAYFSHGSDSLLPSIAVPDATALPTECGPSTSRRQWSASGRGWWRRSIRGSASTPGRTARGSWHGSSATWRPAPCLSRVLPSPWAPNPKAPPSSGLSNLWCPSCVGPQRCRQAIPRARPS